MNGTVSADPERLRAYADAGELGADALIRRCDAVAMAAERWASAATDQAMLTAVVRAVVSA